MVERCEQCVCNSPHGYWILPNCCRLYKASSSPICMSDASLVKTRPPPIEPNRLNGVSGGQNRMHVFYPHPFGDKVRCSYAGRGRKLDQWKKRWKKSMRDHVLLVLTESGDLMRGIRCKTAGFTLIELLVVISIVGVVAAIGLPSYQHTVANMRMSGEINSVLGALNVARNEAIKRGSTVSVCQASSCRDNTCCNNTFTSAVPSCTNCVNCTSTGTNWGTGFAVCALSDTPPTVLVSSGTPQDHLTSSVGAVQFTQMGYPQCGNNQGCGNTTPITLHDANSTSSLYRCIAFDAGLYVAENNSKVTNCP